MPDPRKIAEQKNGREKFTPQADEGRPLFEQKEPREKDYRAPVTKNPPER